MNLESRIFCCVIIWLRLLSISPLERSFLFSQRSAHEKAPGHGEVEEVSVLLLLQRLQRRTSRLLSWPSALSVLSCRCELAYSSRVADAYSTVLADVMHTIPPELLGSLLRQELTEQRDWLLSSQDATGGALAFVPFSPSGSSSSSQRGCLLYPGKVGLDSLSILNKT